MSSSKIPVSDIRGKLEKEIQLQRRDLEKKRLDTNQKSDESIRILSEKLSEKKKELNGCSWIQFLKKSDLKDDIKKLDTRIKELESLKKKENEFEDLEENLFDVSRGQVWGGYPECLDNKIVCEYTDKFKTLSYPLTPTVPYINIIMIGETGAGKSSCLNTFATAITGSKEIKDIYRVSPGKGREKSATQRIHLEPMHIGDNGPQLPCRFYDIPGLDHVGTIKEEELMKIINGELRIDVTESENGGCLKVHRDSRERFLRKNPILADQVHCILYVIKATSNFSIRQSNSLKLMREIKSIINKEDGVRQFVVVTAIDELGVPNEDMKNAYKYRCVRKVCERASEALDVDLLHVLPVSNYCEEVAPNDAKNAISLFNLWRVFHLGKEYIERHSMKKETHEDFKRLLMQEGTR